MPAIDLSADQVHQLQTAETDMLHEVHRIETAFEEHQVNREEAHDQVRAARQAFETAWQKIVTEDQKNRWRALHENRGQKKDRPENDVFVFRRRILEFVDLTDDQIHQIQAATEKARQAIGEAQIDFQHLGEEEIHARIRAAQGELDHALHDILTDDQLQHLRQGLERQQQASDRAHEPLWRRLGRVVDLSAEQVHQIEAAEATFLHRLHRIRNAASDGGLTEQEASEHIHAARGELHQSLVEILSAEQLDRIRESHVFDGDLAADENDEGLFLSDIEPNGFTAVPESSWGELKLDLSKEEQ